MVTRNVRLTLELTERGDAAVVRRPVRILFLAANPRDTGRLSLELEFRELRDALQRSRLADRVELHAEWAVRVGDIQDHLLTYRPTIVHFSGHGVRAPGAALTPGSRDFLRPAMSDPLPAVGEVPGGIVVWGDRGEAVEIAADALVELFRQLEGTTRCVVLNACYSEAQGAALAERVDAVIGMSRAVSDQTAIEFSRALYRAIAHGESLASAFALARNALDLGALPEPDAPRLIVRRPGVDLHSLVLVEQLPVEALLSRLRDADERDVETLRVLGQELVGLVGAARWSRAEEELERARERREPELLSIVSDVAAVHRLPWDLLPLGASGRCLGDHEGFVVRRTWPGTTTIAPRLCPRPAYGAIAVVDGERDGRLVDACVTQLRSLVDEGCYRDGLTGSPVVMSTFVGLDGVLERARQAARPVHVVCVLLGNASTGSAIQSLIRHADMVRLVVLVERGGPAPGRVDSGEAALELARAGLRSVVAATESLDDESTLSLLSAMVRALVVDSRSLERAFASARASLRAASSTSAWAGLQLYTRAADGDDTRPLVLRPYRGLLAFRPEDSRFFFGRDEEVRAIVRKLAALVDRGAPRLLVVAGASGTGKSSTVLAGVLPAFASKQGPPVHVMRPGAQPGESLRRAERALAGGGLLVVDQFEELFTHVEEPERRRAFASRLWALACAPDCKLRVVITIRIDFIGRLDDWPLDDAGLRLGRIAYSEHHSVFIARMSHEQLRSAIESPADRVGLHFEPGLVARMLSDVGDEPGSLPMLEDTLDLLWQHRRGSALQQATYDAGGGITGSLQQRANALIDGLDPGARRAARRMLVRLVSVSEDAAPDTRRRLLVSDLVPTETARAITATSVIAEMVAARLLVRDGDGALTVEIAHETLIRRWSRLRAWIDEDREKTLALRKLDLWARQWSEHNAVLTGERLEYARDQIRRFVDDLSDPARALLAASNAAAARLRRRRWLGVAGALAGIALIGVLGYEVKRSWDARCDGGEQLLAERWDEDARERARAAILATGVPYARAVEERAIQRLDRFATRWVEASRQVCSSAALGNARERAAAEQGERCLVELREQLRRTGERLTAVTSSTAGDALDWIALPSPEVCVDPRFRDAWVSPEGRETSLDELRAALEGPQDQREDSVRLAEAEERMRVAEELGYAPLVAYSLLVLGRLQERAGDVAASEVSLVRTIGVAQKIGAERLRLKALSYLVYTLANAGEPRLRETYQRGEEGLALVEADEGEAVARAELLMALAWAATRGGDLDRALRDNQAAREQFSKSLGASHPATLKSGINLAYALVAARRLDEAEELMQALLSAGRETWGPRDRNIAVIRENLGTAYKLQGRHEEAERETRRALEINYETLGERHKDSATTDFNLAMILDLLERDEEAIEYLRHGLETRELMYAADDPALAIWLREIAWLEIDLGRPERARPELERALAIYERHGASDIALARAWLLQARALAHDDPARAGFFAEGARRKLALHDASSGYWRRLADDLARFDARRSP